MSPLIVAAGGVCIFVEEFAFKEAVSVGDWLLMWQRLEIRFFWTEHDWQPHTPVAICFFIDRLGPAALTGDSRSADWRNSLVPLLTDSAVKLQVVVVDGC